MTSDEYRDAIARLGLNQVQAAAFLRVSPRTSRQYAAHGPPNVVAMLLLLMIAKQISVAEVNRILQWRT